MIFGGGGSALGVIVLIVVISVAVRMMVRGGYGRGPWGGSRRPGSGGPWGGPWGGRGPWGGGPGRGRGQGPPPPPANGQGAPWPANTGPGSTDAAGQASSTAGTWPGDDLPDWRHDTRPAAASVPADIFPERHAARTVPTVQAPAPVDVGLAAVKAHDPAFDLAQFTQQVQRTFFMVEEGWSERNPDVSRRVMADTLWLEHRDQIQGYVNSHKRNMVDYLAVSNISPVAAHSEGGYDTITMCITATSTDYDVDDRTGQVLRGDKQVRQWEKDWTFQRSSKAVTKEGGTSLGTSCPNCGADLDLDVAGTCRHCQAHVTSGEYDWVLVRISPVV